MKTSFKPVAMLIAARMLSFIVTFFIPVVLVRIFAQGTFGAYKQVFLVYVILFGIAQLGMAESLYYFLPLHPAESGKIIVNAVLTLTGAGLTCLALMYGYAPAIAGWLGNPEVAAYVPLMGVFLLFMLVTTVLEISMVARKQFRLASYTYAISDLTRSLFLVIPVLIWRDLRALLLGAIAFAALRLIFTVGYLLREFGASDLRPDWLNLRRQLAYTLPFELAIIVDTLQANYHQYTVSHHFGAIAFAVYAVGCLQLPFVDFVAGPAGNVMMVGMAEELAAKRPQNALSIWQDTTRKLALIFIPMFVLLVTCSREIILLLFTERYAGAIPIFILWSGMVFLAVFQTDDLLRVFARTRLLFVLNLVRLGIVAGAIGWFLSFFGLRGAVLVTTFALAVTKAAALVQGAKLLQVSLRNMLPWGNILKVTAASVAASVPAWIMKQELHLPFIPLLMLMGISFAVSYGALILGFDLLKDGEKLAVAGWLFRPVTGN